jgi:glycosyltransferase involved in cell wall biosynthesis
VLVASEYMAREYVRNGVGAKVTVLPLFVDLPESVVPRKLTRPVTLLFLGRITELKGIDLLIRAAHRFTEISGRTVAIIAAGTGPALATAQALSRKLLVPFEARGWVGDSERTALFDRATLLVIPSTWPEPFGLVGLEAASRGLPTVAFPVGGIGEWLRSGFNGEIAGAHGSSDALASALLRATESEEHYSSLVNGARETARRFNPDSHVDQLLDILRRVLAS